MPFTSRCNSNSSPNQQQSHLPHLQVHHHTKYLHQTLTARPPHHLPTFKLHHNVNRSASRNVSNKRQKASSLPKICTKVSVSYLHIQVFVAPASGSDSRLSNIPTKPRYKSIICINQTRDLLHEL